MSTAIFYIPHQDDEIVSFGTAILNHLFAGDDVHLVLCTDGAGSGVRAELNGDRPCRVHNRTYRFGLSKQDFSLARNREFFWSAGCLGVPPDHIHLRQHIEDGCMTGEQAEAVIREFARRYPGASHRTFTYTDPHPDHHHLGFALQRLYDANEVGDARFYFKTSEMQRFEGTWETAAPEQLPFLRAANHAYRVFVPGRGLYSIGYLSVPGTFDTQLENPRCKYHKPGEFVKVKNQKS